MSDEPKTSRPEPGTVIKGGNIQYVPVSGASTVPQAMADIAEIEVNSPSFSPSPSPSASASASPSPAPDKDEK